LSPFFSFVYIPQVSGFLFNRVDEFLPKYFAMEIENCSPSDLPAILNLYEAARALQTERNMVVWPHFTDKFLMSEIEQNRQWKISVDGRPVCNWAITYTDKEIWEEKDKSDSIFIHRICTHPDCRGNRYIDSIVDWAKQYANQLNRKYIRLDTLGKNTKLIEYYTSAGFSFLGIFKLTNTQSLPKHYQDEPNCCLFEIKL
jgi:ribosomal protein S18 acetylase RimI-like enzyme